jgi:hypothetical protein
MQTNVVEQKQQVLCVSQGSCGVPSCLCMPGVRVINL